jgi:hypothetical protein
MKMFYWIVLFFLSLLLVVTSASAVNKEITLAWDHDRGDLAGFKIYYGNESGSYSTDVDVIMASLCSIYSLEPEEFCHKLTIDIPEDAETTYYFAATAYDAENNESAKSEEATATYDFLKPPAVTDLSASFDKGASELTFNWTYETDWLPKIVGWSLWESDTSLGSYTKVVDIPYNPQNTPPYSANVTIEAPVGGTVTKYYVLVANRGEENNNAFSANSNEVSVTIDKMPPKSPFEFKIKIK